MKKVETINVEVYELNLPTSLCIIAHPSEKNRYSLQGGEIRKVQ
jgi:hypothetical protein